MWQYRSCLIYNLYKPILRIDYWWKIKFISWNCSLLFYKSWRVFLQQAAEFIVSEHLIQLDFRKLYSKMAQMWLMLYKNNEVFVIKLKRQRLSNNYCKVIKMFLICLWCNNNIFRSLIQLLNPLIRDFNFRLFGCMK